MDPTSQFIVPTIIDVPELIVTSEDVDYDDTNQFGSGPFGSNGYFMNKLQFVSPALTYIIGLGNLWRFPYLCYKHAGGAFLLAYTLTLLTIGTPLLLMELAFGQYANEGPITIWRISPAFEGIGYAMCLVSATIALYYNIINTWLVHYLLGSLTLGSLPWTNCDNQWNGEHCFYKPDRLTKGTINNCTMTITTNNKTSESINDNPGAGFIENNTNATSILLVPGNCTSQLSGSSGDQQANSSGMAPFAFDKVLNTSDEVFLPSNEYFHNNVLELSASPNEWGGPNWSLLFILALVWFGAFIVLLKNLHRPLTNNRQLALLSLVMPYLVLFALFVRALTLNGASAGIRYYVQIDWDRFQNIDIWTDASTQLFFAMSPCWGGIITLANMNKFHNNFQANTLLIVTVNYFTSILMGLISFATLGYMSNYSGIDLSEVVDSGVGFMFQVLPETIAQLPFANVNSALIFATLLFLGCISQLTVIETVITTIVDTWPHKLRYRRPLVLMILCASQLLLSLPMCFSNGLYLVQAILDPFVGTITAMTIGVLELIAIAWVYGTDNFMQDIDDMISVHRNLFPSRLFWHSMWRYLAPSVLFAILLFTITDLPVATYRALEMPGWTRTVGWALTLASVSTIPIIAFVRFLLSPQGSFMDKISYLCRPSEDWAPSSYVSGPKLINRHEVLDDSDLVLGGDGGNLHTFKDHTSSSHSDRVDPDCSSAMGTSRANGGANGTKGRSGTSGTGRSTIGSRDPGVGTVYPSGRERIPASGPYRDRVDSDSDSRNDSENDDDDGDDDDEEEDLKVINGKANYIIPEEEDDTDTGLITNETNV